MEHTPRAMPTFATEKIVCPLDHILPEVIDYHTSTLAEKNNVLCQLYSEDNSPGLIRRNTDSGPLIARDDEGPIVVAARTNILLENGYGLPHAPWMATPLTKKKMTMPSGKLVEAKISPSGLTMMLLSEKQVAIHPIDNAIGIAYQHPRSRYPLTRNIEDLPLINGSGKVRSGNISDEFVLLRGAGQVRVFQFWRARI